MDIQKKCVICRKMKPLKSFKRNRADICNSCYYILQKAKAKGFLKVELHLSFTGDMLSGKSGILSIQSKQ